MRVTLGLNRGTNNYTNFQGKRDAIAFIDYDGTYEDPKHPESKSILEDGLAKLKAKYAKKGINFMPCIVTARPKARIMQKNPTPEIAWTITQNGGEIVKGLPTPDKTDLAHWKVLNEGTGFKAKQVQEAVFKIAEHADFANLKVVKIEDVVKNPAASECEFMQPFCIALDNITLDKSESPEILSESNYKTPKQISRFVETIKSTLKKQGVNFEINEPYLFKGMPYLMFDIATPFANKENAIKFLLKELDIAPENVIVAGDGGNDIVMMKPLEGNPAGDGRNLIIVGENKGLRQSASLLFNNSAVIRPSTEPSSLGVLEGLKIHLEAIAKRIGHLRK